MTRKNIMASSCATKNQILMTDETDIESILKQLAEDGPPEAFYVCDLRDVIKKYRVWMQEMPRITPFYAVKCNSDPIIVEMLAALGTGFDCASQAEIKQILDLGVKPERIIFANPIKMIPQILYAKSVNVDTMTFDCPMELHKIKQHFPSAKVLIRIRCDNPEAHYQLGKKFGCDPDTEAENLLKLSIELEIQVIGVAFHVGSLSKNPNIYRKAIISANHVFKIGSALGLKFDLLDIGGGFLGEHDTSILETAQVINRALDEFFPDQSVKVISEPGRYFVSSAFTLCTNIHTIKESTEKNRPDSKQYEYYIDEGIYTSFLYLKFDEITIPHWLKTTPENPETYLSNVWGPTCDCSDIVCKEVQLPKLEMFDWIYFRDMGSYTLSLCTPFNGFPLAKIKYVVSEKEWGILKNEMSKAEYSVDKLKQR